MVSRGRRSQIVRVEAEPGEAILACDPTRGCNLFRRFSAVANQPSEIGNDSHYHGYLSTLSAARQNVYGAIP